MGYQETLDALTPIVSNLGIDSKDLDEAHILVNRIRQLYYEINDLGGRVESKICRVCESIVKCPDDSVIEAAFPNSAFTREAVRNLHLGGHRLLNTIIGFEL
jgi:hypothetical protein